MRITKKEGITKNDRRREILEVCKMNGKEAKKETNSMDKVVDDLR